MHNKFLSNMGKWSGFLIMSPVFKLYIGNWVAIKIKLPYLFLIFSFVALILSVKDSKNGAKNSASHKISN